MMERLATELKTEVPTDLETPEAVQFFKDQCKKHKVDCNEPRTSSRMID